ncbi:MAG: winged helix-turn-helix domain-containing protein [Opitutales bacterium]
MDSTPYRRLEEQERAICRELIRCPRCTDKHLSDATGIPLRTVGRKRKRLEEAGILKFFCEVELGAQGTGQYPSRHLYILHFRVGVSLEEIRGRFIEEASRHDSNGTVYETALAEIDGRLAMLIYIDGHTEKEIVRRMHDNVIPSFIRNHGEGVIDYVSNMRVLESTRRLRNYVPSVNMNGNGICSGWPVEYLYTGD